MANAPKKPRATYADIEALPANVVGEIVDGELFVMPRPRPLHANTAGNLREELRGPFQRGRGGPGGWWILPEVEIHLVPDEPVVPDLSGWRRERMPALPASAKVTLSPDWICEVLSDSTEAHDRRDKMPLYARHGVAHVWLVDPVLRYCHRPLPRRCRPFRQASSVRARPLGASESGCMSSCARWFGWGTGKDRGFMMLDLTAPGTTPVGGDGFGTIGSQAAVQYAGRIASADTSCHFAQFPLPSGPVEAAACGQRRLRDR